MKIYSIFSSINGEANCRGQGSWCTFVRFAGCSLGCSYCDTKYAQDFDSGQDMSITQVIKTVEQYGLPYVMITGGEPLEQPLDLVDLVNRLKRKGYHVTVETNGSWVLPLRTECEVDCYVLDFKLPSAGLGQDVFAYENIIVLARNDFIKFVISNMQDYETAKRTYRQLMQRNAQLKYAFSPVIDKLSPNHLYGWMLEDRIWNVQLSLQLHKIVQLSEPR